MFNTSISAQQLMDKWTTLPDPKERKVLMYLTQGVQGASKPQTYDVTVEDLK
jgi:hypothetical protein